jgi:hypothetical protein
MMKIFSAKGFRFWELADFIYQVRMAKSILRCIRNNFWGMICAFLREIVIKIR